MSISLFTPTQANLDERTASSTSSTPAIPTISGGVLADDLILAFGVSGGSNATGFSTPTTGASWSSVDQHCSTANTLAPAMALFRRWATGGESGTITFPHGNIVTTTGIIVVRGVDKTNPFDIATIVGDKTTVNTQIQVVPSTRTIITTGTLGLYIFTCNSTSTDATPPSGWSEDNDRNTGLTGNRSFTVGHKAALAAGSLAAINGAWGGSTRDIGLTLFFRPKITDSGIYRLDAGPVLVPVAVNPF